MSNPLPNANVPQIPQPIADVGALAYALRQVKQGMDSLAGYRGKPNDRAVTFNDLLSLGVISTTSVGAVTGVTAVVAGSGLSGGTITSAGTISLGTIVASSLMGNASAGGAVPGAIVVGTGLSLSVAGTLTSTAVGTAGGDLSGAFPTPAVAKVNGVVYPASPAVNTFPVVTATGTVSYVSTSQIPGSSTNDSASAGKVGEFISSTVLVGAAVALVTGTDKDVTSISLTGGDWDVSGNVCTSPAGTTTTSLAAGWISQTSTTTPTAPNAGAFVLIIPAATAGAANFLPVGTMRQSLAGTTTVFLTGVVNFAVSTMSMYGFIGARRRR